MFVARPGKKGVKCFALYEHTLEIDINFQLFTKSQKTEREREGEKKYVDLSVRYSRLHFSPYDRF